MDETTKAIAMLQLAEHMLALDVKALDLAHVDTADSRYETAFTGLALVRNAARHLGAIVHPNVDRAYRRALVCSRPDRHPADCVCNTPECWDSEDDPT